MRLSLIVFLTFLALFAACTYQQEKELIRPVRSIVVERQSSVRDRVFSGVAQSGVVSKLSFKVSGTVSHLPVKVGDKVGVGELLAEIDARDYELRVQEVEASLLQAEAQARASSANYDRVRHLYENQNASRNDLDSARASAESASAQVKALQKRKELSETQVLYTRLEAPIAGAISEVSVEINENVGVGQPVLTLTSGGKLEVKVTVPEAYISRIQEGDRCRVEFDAVNGKSFPAVVREVGIAATETGTTFPVTVRLVDDVPGIRSGMAAEVSIFLQGEAGNAIVVPSNAVAEDGQGRFLFVVVNIQGEIGYVERREVVVGDIVSEGIVITRGIAAGERLVTAGVHKIKDQQKVRVLEEK